MSGLATLVLSKEEVLIIEQETLRNLQRLHACTPRPVTYFLAGSLPGTALLHLRQLTLFGMICRLPEGILNKHARNILSSVTPSSKSWFFQIRDLCLLYRLPHPLNLLSSPTPKETFKKMIKSHVIDHWEQTLRSEASPLTSLEFFKPSFMSLSKPHPIWSTPGSSPAKIAMASTQARMLSGRYRTEKLCSNWTKHSTGVCQLSESCSSTAEDIRHILAFCGALQPTREKLMRFSFDYCKSFPPIRKLVHQFCHSTNPQFCQFLLDCSVLPPVILEAQLHGSEVLHHLFHITRTWCYTLHKERMKILGRWNHF